VAALLQQSQNSKKRVWEDQLSTYSIKASGWSWCDKLDWHSRFLAHPCGMLVPYAKSDFIYFHLTNRLVCNLDSAASPYLAMTCPSRGHITRDHLSLQQPRSSSVTEDKRISTQKFYNARNVSEEVHTIRILQVKHFQHFAYFAAETILSETLLSVCFNFLTILAYVV